MSLTAKQNARIWKTQIKIGNRWYVARSEAVTRIGRNARSARDSLDELSAKFGRVAKLAGW